ncbi:DUF2637 domain-containing protein [Gandjariella thermophila]|uniref:DUF2637 domain-containing protein n=1 Tax=Gandjariella thermophila TaxID=1931992 RepID=A0A4D4J092_9PSEU|nr:DUF2637 domain-containing protein [Gandjariella thermophila]GDY28774.1 hypothetical protein GTS_04070 [Gandjariella thermophila]
MSARNKAAGFGGWLAGAIPVLVATVLGGIGAAAGFTHTHDWAEHHGQHGWLAWADAVVIEGIATVAGFEIHRDHRAGRHPSWRSFPVVVLVVGFVVQMAAQVAEAEPSLPGWLLAAMPALGFLTVVKLLIRRIPADTPAPSTPDTDHTDKATNREAPARPAPSAATAAGASARPVPRTRLRLPTEMREAIHATADQAARDGRELTVDDVRQAVRVPADLAEQIVREINHARNGHTLTGSTTHTRQLSEGQTP